MKFNKKRVVVVSLVVSLLAILSFGTLAWFNASDSVTNTFHVADSDDDDTKADFAIDVKETVPGEEEGTDEIVDDGHTFNDILPGDVLLKKPVIKNTGLYDQWVRVNVLISKDFADQVAEEQGTTFDLISLDEIIDGIPYAKLEANREVGAADTYTDYYVYAYYLAEPLAPEAEITMFEAVKIPCSFTQDDMIYGEDGFQIIVKADAVQAGNLEGPASAAFACANWEVGTNYEK